MRKFLVNRQLARQILADPPARTFAMLEAEGVIVPSVRGKGGRPSVYDLAVIVPAYIVHLATARPSSQERVARARRDQAVAELTELRIAERRKQLLPREQIIFEGRTIILAARAKLLGLPHRMVQEGTIARNHEDAVAVLVREALEEMSQWSSVDDLEKAIAAETAERGKQQ